MRCAKHCHAQARPAQGCSRRHAKHLNTHRGTQVLDLGCGVGGPAREVCRFSGAAITGVNNNAHQIKRCQQISEASGPWVAGKCAFTQADFMKLPFSAGDFDHAYAIEATCHAPDAAACYAEIARCLKPGGMFVVYEWVRTLLLTCHPPLLPLECGLLLHRTPRPQRLLACYGPAGVTCAALWLRQRCL